MWRIVDTHTGATERTNLSEWFARKLAGIFNRSDSRGRPGTRFKAEPMPPKGKV